MTAPSTDNDSANDTEGGCRGWIDLVDGKLHNFLDRGTGWTSPDGQEQSLSRRIRPLGGNLDASIRTVADPPSQLQPVRRHTDEVPKPHALY